MSEEPKLIIDSDWKAQAQAEKDRLAKKTAPASPAAPAPSSPAAPGAAAPAAPGAPDAAAAAQGEAAPFAGDPRFEELISFLVTNALSYMGVYPDPQTGQPVVSLEGAKIHIDMLAVLEEKTRGNLTEGESSTLSKVVSQLRLEFVELSKAVARAIQEGRVRQTGGAGGPGLVNPGAMGPGGMMGPGMGGPGMSGPGMGGGRPPTF